MTHTATELVTACAIDLVGAGAAKVRTISLVSTWTEMLPSLLAVYESGSTMGRAACLKELQRMASAADTACVLLDGLAERADADLNVQEASPRGG